MSILGWLALAIVVAATVATGVAIRRRTARCVEAFLVAVAAGCRSQGAEVERDETTLAVKVDGDRTLRLPSARIGRLRDEPPAAVSAALVSLAHRPLGSLHGSLSLKHHGPRLAPLLRDGAVFDLLGRRHGLALGELPGLRVRIAYAVDGDPARCVTDDHLHEAGIDRRDLHGIALAVTRQRFEEGRLSAAAEVDTQLEVSLEDDITTDWMLVGTDFLDPGQRLELRVTGARRRPPAPVSTAVTVALERERLSIL